MTPNNGLSVNKSILVLTLVPVWVILSVLIFFSGLPTTGIYPTVWIFSSSILLLLGLLIRFKADLRIIFSLNQFSLKWLVFSLLMASIFWLINSYLMGDFTPGNEKITLWQQSINHFNLVSIGISSILLAPLFEEMYFRGLLLITLKQKSAPWLSITISALLFALIHWSWPEFISLLVIGLIYAWMTLKSNSIFPALLAHIIHNALTFGLYSL